MSDAATQDTAIERFKRSRRMARYLSHAVLLEEGGISVFVRSAMVMLSVGFLALVAWSATTEIKETAITFGQVMPTSAVNKIQHLEGGIIEQIMVRSAMVMLSVGFLALVAWSATTEIKETAITFGQVMPTSAVNKIQHLEGGIIEQIMVRDGDLVEKGQVLVRLKADGAQAELSQTETRLGNLQLESERYRALAEGREPDFTALMVQYPELAQNQAEIYRIQTELDANQNEILQVQIKERNAELAQLSEQEATLRKSVDLLSQEVTMRRSLYEQGLNSKVLFLNIQRELNEAQGNLSGVVAEQARARETIAEANLRLNELEKSQREEAITELGRLGGEIAQAREALRKLRDRVERLEIVAPTRGYIKGLQFTTIGGVIAPAQMVMELVPVDDVLIAETRISTEDIGHVHLGQPVTVKVSAFDFIRYGGISGELVSISASTFVDEDGRPYYKGKVALDHDAVGEGATAQKIIPGMTVQADIQTGERTLLQYLLKPVYVSLDQAFSER